LLNESVLDSVYQLLLILNAQKETQHPTVTGLTRYEIRQLLYSSIPDLEVQTVANCLTVLCAEGLVESFVMKNRETAYRALTPVEIVQAKKNKSRSINKKVVKPQVK